MNIEQAVNDKLNQFPYVKKGVKRIYQGLLYSVSEKMQAEGEIVKLSPDDLRHEYFFGYYDKSPWDAGEQHVLCLRAKDMRKSACPDETADILLIDAGDNRRYQKIAQTSAWNVQQGCMLQWLGPDFKSRIIYNDYRNGRLCSVIRNIQTSQEQVIDFPVYAVSRDGKTALSLDFARLHRLRPGYGYLDRNQADVLKPLPEGAAIWKISLETGEIKEILKYSDFAGFQPRREMSGEGVIHKVNHIMIRPDGKRFLVLYRWRNGHRKYTRLITASMDGSDMYLLLDDDMVSHCCWKNNTSILAYANTKKQGAGYYLIKDKTDRYMRCWPGLQRDGHPGYAPDGRMAVTDSYPDRKRISTVMLVPGKQEHEKHAECIAKVFAPFAYDNETRCDLHPRWSPSGNKICFDSAHEGKRGLYCVSVNPKRRRKVVFLLTSCKRIGPVRQMLYIMKHMDRTMFESILITLYEEEESSMLEMFLPYGTHIPVLTGRAELITGLDKKLKTVLKMIKPDVIHSLGVLPDYAASRIHKYPHVMTLRNFIWEDYPAKFGRIKGSILAELHIYAMKHADKTVACSRSLSQIYKKRLHDEFDYICNGVDFTQYRTAGPSEKQELRQALGLPQKAVVFVYTGQLIQRKNMDFLLDAFSGAASKEHGEYFLLVLGGGDEYARLSARYSGLDNIDFRGDVSDVSPYLQAGDIYVSASRSEGMPNGVLEAVASGLPVLLSDIPQHMEILEMDERLGSSFCQDNRQDLIDKMVFMGERCRMHHDWDAADISGIPVDAVEMSRRYQEIYLSVCRL